MPHEITISEGPLLQAHTQRPQSALNAVNAFKFINIKTSQ